MAAVTIGQPMTDIHLNDTDRAIIAELREGRNIPSNIADEIDRTQQYTRERIARLEEHGLVRNVGRGVYELVE